MAFTLSVVIPVYNEERYIDEVVDRVRSVKFQDGVSLELIAVDDCSKDKTYERLQALEAKGILKVKRHEKNQGKGAALHTGFTMVTGDAVVIQDSDFEYDPNDLPGVLQPILDGKADVVFGARTSVSGYGGHKVMYYWHSKINKFLTVFCNMFSDLALSDMECCYKMFRSQYLKDLKLKEKRFGFEPEVTCKLARLHPLVFEVPVSYAPRSYEEGKKINWKDGVSALRCIIKYGIFRA